MAEADEIEEDGAEAAFAALRGQVSALDGRLDRQAQGIMALTEMVEALQQSIPDYAPALAEVLGRLQRLEAKPTPRQEVTAGLVRSEVGSAIGQAVQEGAESLRTVLEELRSARRAVMDEAEAHRLEVGRIRRVYVGVWGPLAVLFGLAAMAQLVLWYPSLTAYLMPPSWRPAYAAQMLGMEGDVVQALQRQAVEAITGEVADRPAINLAKAYEPALVACLLRANASHRAVSCPLKIEPPSFVETLGDHKHQGL